MKKYWISLVLIISALILFGCGDTSDVEMSVEIISNEEVTNTEKNEVDTEEILLEAEISVAESIVNSYYGFVMDKQVNQMATLLADKVIENAGGTENTITALEMRTYLIGDIDSYEITESSEGELDGIPAIKCYVQVKYKSGQEVIEEFVVSEGEIIDVILPNQDNTSRITENYLRSFGDKEAMASCLLPAAVANIDMEDYNKDADLFAELLGEYVGYDVIDEEYVDVDVENITVYYKADTIYAHYENMNLVGHLQIAYEEGVTGINYQGFIPENLIVFMDEYLNRMQSDDMDAMMELYSDRFYVEMGETPDSWKGTLEILMGEMSDEVSYQVFDWDYMIMPLSDGTELPILGFSASVNYNGTEYIERFILNYDGQPYQIQRYELSAVE